MYRFILSLIHLGFRTVKPIELDSKTIIAF